MRTPVNERWERARAEMLERWRRILAGIEARDEAGVLALANVMDEFCEEAIRERQEAASGRSDVALPLLKFPPAGAISGRCVFCRGFAELGGCFGVLHELNRAVLNQRWRTAQRVAEEYIEKLRELELQGAREPQPH